MDLTNLSTIENLMRTTYALEIIFERRVINRIIIDHHYKEKHSYLDDEMILNLLLLLNSAVIHQDGKKGNFSFYKVEPILLLGKSYRLILVLEENEDYLGVINAYRIKNKKV